MSFARVDSITTSTPRFIFNDLLLDPTGATSQTFALPAPQDWSVVPNVKRNTNESQSGETEHLFYFSKQTFTLAWSWLDETERAWVRRLWESTHDGTAFSLVRHQNMGGGGWPYEDELLKLHDNLWTVEWDPGQKSMPLVLKSGVGNAYTVTMKMREVF